MKKNVAFLLLALFTLPVMGQGHEEDYQDRMVNIGVRAGFNSSMYQVSKFRINDVTIGDTQNNYKIGYFGAVFLRLNFQHHYLQPEVCYQISRCEIGFDKLGSQHEEVDPDYAYIKSTIHSIEVPVLYGYNIVKTGPYALSVFAGPKVKLLWKKRNRITFDNFDQEGIQEELHPLNLSVTAGVAVNISRIFFDFRYEQGLNNISKSISHDTDAQGTSGIVFKRREANLSFSLGFMF